MPVECMVTCRHNYHASGIYFQLYYGHWTDILMLRVIRNAADQITVAPNMRGSA